MQPIQSDHVAGSRVRLVFDSTVLSFNFAADVTLGDIALILGEVGDQRHGRPVAVDVTLPRG